MVESKSADYPNKINIHSEFSRSVRPLATLRNFRRSECEAPLSRPPRAAIIPHGRRLRRKPWLPGDIKLNDASRGRLSQGRVFNHIEETKKVKENVFDKSEGARRR